MQKYKKVVRQGWLNISDNLVCPVVSFWNTNKSALGYDPSTNSQVKLENRANNFLLEHIFCLLVYITVSNNII